MSETITIVNREDIVAIADAVRNKTGNTGEMTLDGIASGINNIQTGIDLPELTNEGSASDMLEGKQLIDDEGNVITGSMSNNGTISSTMDGINTKSVSIPSGYTSGGTVSLDNTIDNEVSEQTNLIAQIMDKVENLPEAGSNSGGIDLPELTNPATEDEVFLNKEYINFSGEKKVGTFSIDSELNAQDDIITQIQTLVEQKASYNTVYVGTSVPTNDIGVNGDIYIVRSEA